MEETHRARYMERGVEFPRPLPMDHSPQLFMCSPTPKLSNFVLWVFMETFMETV